MGVEKGIRVPGQVICDYQEKIVLPMHFAMEILKNNVPRIEWFTWFNAIYMAIKCNF